MEFLSDLDQGTVILSICGLFIIVIFLIILNMMQLRKTRKQYLQMINGGRSDNIEQVIIDLQGSVNHLNQQNSKISMEIEQMKQYMRKMKSHLGIQRYNAFSQDSGSDLSFSLAIMNEDQDGVVLTGIHGREQTFLYAKPVEKGQSTYSLTPEEKAIIDRIAVKSNA